MPKAVPPSPRCLSLVCYPRPRAPKRDRCTQPPCGRLSARPLSGDLSARWSWSRLRTPPEVAVQGAASRARAEGQAEVLKAEAAGRSVLAEAEGRSASQRGGVLEDLVGVRLG